MGVQGMFIPVSPQHGGPANGSGAFAPPNTGHPPAASGGGHQQQSYQPGYQAPPPAAPAPAGPPASCNLSNVDTSKVPCPLCSAPLAWCEALARGLDSIRQVERP